MGLAYIALCDWKRNLVPIECLTQIPSDLVICVFPPLTSNARVISVTALFQPLFAHTPTYISKANVLCFCCRK